MIRDLQHSIRWASHDVRAGGAKGLYTKNTDLLLLATFKEIWQLESALRAGRVYTCSSDLSSTPPLILSRQWLWKHVRFY